MRPSLPVQGISLVDIKVVEKPGDDEKAEKLAEKFQGIFPASVVTCLMKAKKEAIKEQGGNWSPRYIS